MQTLLHTLMEYTDRTTPLPAAYWDALRASSRKQTALESDLTEPQRKQLEALLETEHTLHVMDAENLFRSGVALGLKLSRL
jgi:hypothetical protein